MQDGRAAPVRQRKRKKSSRLHPLGLILAGVMILGAIRMAAGQPEETAQTAPIQLQTQPIATTEATAAPTVELPALLESKLEKNPELAQFAAAYPGSVPETVDLSADYTPGEIPHFLQWDLRWGYAPYGGERLQDCVGLSGCGPTALAMVIVGLTGDTQWNPGAVAQWAADNGYCTASNGTRWTLMSEGCEHFGLKSEEVILWEATMIQVLRDGPIICAMGPGDFTDSGHFIVISAYSDGLFQVLDPNSREKSHGWSYDQLSGQISGMWWFSNE